MSELLKQIFSIENTDEKTKRLTILGAEMFFKRKIKKMKLGIAYNLFDGEELLEASVKSVRGCADYICVIYQKKQ